MPRGYLGADLFFILSGFVLGHAYEHRLQHGLGRGQFLRLRLQRTYPLYFLGALTGCLLINGSPLMLLMIPTASPDGLLFRANAPLWSLLYELAVNLCWAVIAVRWRLRSLVFALPVLAVPFVWGVVSFGNADLGAHWQTIGPGLGRTAFSFTVGLILFRLHRRAGSPQTITPNAWALPVLLVLALAVPFTDRVAADLVTVALVLPAIVWLGACWQTPQTTLAARLGGLSFPLYCLHAPFVAMGHASTALMSAICLGMIGLALLLDRLYDQPVQAWLRRHANALHSPQLAQG